MNALRQLLKRLLGRPNGRRTAGSSRTVSVNGQTYQGDCVAIVNGQVFVDGREVTPEGRQRIEVVVHGDLVQLDVDACHSIRVAGSVGNLRTTSGDVQCGDVTGSVTTVSGDVSCQRVQGNVRTVSGDVSR